MNGKRTVVDNVIYANFGRVTKVEKPKASSTDISDKRCFAARFLLEALSGQADAGRVSRGLKYARSGNVVELSFLKGRIVGSVAGSQNEPFDVAIILPHRGADDITKFFHLITELPQAIKLIRQGKLPEALVRSLLAEQANEIVAYCDCPDYSTVCKHTIAVAQVAADYIEQSPERIFALRGMDLQDIERAIGQVAEVSAKKNTIDSSMFWSGKPLPELPDPEVIPAIDDSDLDALRKAFRHISYTTVDELRGVADIEDMYEVLTRE